MLTLSTLALLSSLTTISELPTVAHADAVCSTLTEKQTVVVNSNGGNLGAFLTMGDCIHDKKINLVIVKALSAAAYMVSSANYTCIWKETLVGYHTPYISIGGVMLDAPLSEMRTTLMYVRGKLLKWGVEGSVASDIIILTLFTPSDKMTYLQGEDVSGVLQKTVWCGDLKPKEKPVE